MIYFSSDHHFYHSNVIRYCDRPYESVEQMNEDLKERWNRRVKEDDEVFYLGDFSLSFRAVEVFTEQLNGIKYLIPGNHDFCHSYHPRSRKDHCRERWIKKYEELGWKVLPEMVSWSDSDITLQFCHLPYYSPNRNKDKYAKWRPTNLGESYLLCGHVHEKWVRQDNMINVGVDAWDYAPVSLAEIKKYLEVE